MNTRSKRCLVTVCATALSCLLLGLAWMGDSTSAPSNHLLVRYNAQYRTSNFFKKAANSQTGTARTWSHPNAISARSSSTLRGR